ncbi:MAG TPA: tachylectin-related carbohydrate-binding protein [Nitrospirales bacterium]
MKMDIPKTKKLVALILSAFMTFGTLGPAVADTLPGEPAPPSSASSEHLSDEEALKAAVEWAKFGKEPDGGKAIDTTIGVISVAYPPAGIVLTIAWGILKSMATGSDPVGEALKALNARMDLLQKRLDILQAEVNAIRDEGFRNANNDRMRELLARHDRMKLLTSQLSARPTDQYDKNSIVTEAQIIAGRFLPTTDVDRDLWRWSDMHVFTGSDGKLHSQLLPASFKVLPTFEYYASALLLYMAAVEYALNGNTALIMSTYGKDLLKHAAFLSVRPTWREFGAEDDGITLPEQIMKRVACYIEPVSRYPTADRVCNANFFCDDWMRLTKRGVGTTTFTMPNNKDMCMLSVRPARTVSAQEQQQRLTAATANPVYGSQAISLWEQWGGRADRVVANEDEMETDYGVGAMALLAEKLERLAKYGGTREQFIGTFDYTYYSNQFLYVTKANGELLWHKHVIGIDKNPPKEQNFKEMQVQPAGKVGGVLKELSTRGLDEPTGVESQEPAPIEGTGVEGRGIGKVQPKTGTTMTAPGTTVTQIGPGMTATQAAALVPKAPGPRVFHKTEGPKKVGTGWASFREVIPGGLSAMYGLTADGVLKWYRHDGFLDGTMNWKGPVDVGTGWNKFKKIVGGGDGVLYGIQPDGALHWYRHNDVADPAKPPKWSAPRVVGSGWQTFAHVFSTGEGIMYAVTPDGRLLWYRHKAYLTGEPQWEGPKEVGTGWTGFKRVFSPGQGMIYGLKADGTLLWYQHDGYQDGTVKWQGPTEINAAWGDFIHVFPRMWGTPTSPVVR